MAKRNKKNKISKSKPSASLIKPSTKVRVKKVKEPIAAKWQWIIGLMMAVLAMAIYSPSINYDFVYDDDAVIKDNKFVKKGLEGLGEIWSTSYFTGYDETMNARAFRPIPLTTLAMEVKFFGLNTKVHHGANILFYGLTGLFLFLLLAKLFRNFHPFVPIATCLLFLLHPIHLEVVANIKSRDTMLGFLGVCLAGWFLLKHLDSKKIVPLLLSLTFFFVGLFSKEEVITLLAGFPLMLWFFRKHDIPKIAKTMLPYLAAVVIFLIYRSSVVGGLNEGVALTKLDNSLLAANGFAERSASQFIVLGNYLLKSVFPHPLLSDYSYLTLPLVNWDDWRVYVSLLFNLGLLVVGLHGLVKRKAHGFGPLWYFSTVSIFTSLVVTNVSAYNDRFLYVPVLGIVFLFVFGTSKLINEGPSLQVGRFLKSNFLPVAIVAILATVGIGKIESHLPYWKDRYMLFEHDVQLAPQNARMRKNYGGSFARKAIDFQTSDPQLAQQYARQAIEQLDYALSMHPNIPTGHIHKGNMHIILNEYPEAIKALENSLIYAPSNYFSKASLGNVYFRNKEYEKSIQTIESIPDRLRNPADIDVLARSYTKLGNIEKANQLRRGK